MSVFRRQYPDGRLSKDWYINSRIHGKQFKRRIGPNKKLVEQVLADIELKQAVHTLQDLYVGTKREHRGEREQS